MLLIDDELVWLLRELRDDSLDGVDALVMLLWLVFVESELSELAVLAELAVDAVDKLDGDWDDTDETLLAEDAVDNDDPPLDDSLLPLLALGGEEALEAEDVFGAELALLWSQSEIGNHARHPSAPIPSTLVGMPVPSGTPSSPNMQGAAVALDAELSDDADEALPVPLVSEDTLLWLLRLDTEVLVPEDAVDRLL